MELIGKLNKTYTIDDIKFRHLQLEDFDKGYFELLSYLSVADKPNQDNFIKQFKLIENNDFIEIYVIELDSIIVGNITLLIEPKFIRNLGKVLHIEDFVIHKDYQNKKLGTKFCELVKLIAKEHNCYKIILDCSEKVMPFYIKQGFEKKSEGMAFYFNK